MSRRSKATLTEAFADPDVVLAQDNDVRLQVAEAVNRLRRYRGLNQSELAAKAGLRQKDISLLESADHNSTMRTIEKVIAALDGRFVLAILPSHWARPNITRPEPAQ